MTRWVKQNAGVVITLAVLIISIVSQFVVAQYQIADLREDNVGIKAQQQFDHDTITAMRQDVLWIRKVLEQWEKK